MPFKSQAQRRFFYAAEARGDISKSTVKEWESATPKGKKLPEKVKKAAMNEILLAAFADELEKIAMEKDAGLGSLVGKGLTWAGKNLAGAGAKLTSTTAKAALPKPMAAAPRLAEHFPHARALSTHTDQWGGATFKPNSPMQQIKNAPAMPGRNQAKSQVLSAHEQFTGVPRSAETVPGAAPSKYPTKDLSKKEYVTPQAAADDAAYEARRQASRTPRPASGTQAPIPADFERTMPGIKVAPLPQKPSPWSEMVRPAAAPIGAMA